MFRILLYLLILIGALASIPAVRKRAAGPVTAVSNRLAPYVLRVVTPVKNELCAREAGAIAGQLGDIRATGHTLPTSDQLQRWINENLSVGRDPWHHDYFLVTTDRGTYVASAGADGKPNTADDIRARVP